MLPWLLLGDGRRRGRTSEISAPPAAWHPLGVLQGDFNQAIFDFNGRSYIAYHNAKLADGGEHRRSVAVEELRYGAEGAIRPVAQTVAGPRPNPSSGCKPSK